MYSIRDMEMRPNADSPPIPSGQSIPDEELYLQFLKTRDPSSFSRLVERFHGPAYRVARSMCGESGMAEECVQEAFIAAMKGKNQFDNRGAGAFRAWFYRLVSNATRMAVRSETRTQRRNKVAQDLNTMRKEELSAAGKKSSKQSSEIQQILESTLDGLDEQLRAPVVLHYVEGLQQTEVASVLGVSQQTISRRIDQGLKLLRGRLQKAGFSLSVGALAGTLQQQDLYTCPIDWPNRLYEQLADSMAENPMPIENSASGSSMSFSILALSLMAVMGIGVGIVLSDPNQETSLPQQPTNISEPSQPQPKPEPTTTASVKEVPVRELPLAQETIHKKWDFDNGIPTDLLFVRSKPKWIKEGSVNGSGALVAGTKILGISFPEKFPDNLLVSFQFRIPKNGIRAQYGGKFIDPQFPHEKLKSFNMNLQVYSPVENLNDFTNNRMDLYFDQSKKEIITLLNDDPLFLAYPVSGNSTIEVRPTAFFSNMTIDNFSVRTPTTNETKRFREIRMQKAYAVYNNFDKPFFNRNQAFPLRLIGDGKFQKSTGINGSGALLINGTYEKPISIITRAGYGLGLQVTRFDWNPLPGSSWPVENLSSLLVPENLLNENADLSILSTPIPYGDYVRKTYPKAIRPGIGKWHKVTIVQGVRGGYILINNQLFSNWGNSVTNPTIICSSVQFRSRCKIDNFKLSVEPEDTFNEVITKATLEASEAKPPE